MRVVAEALSLARPQHPACNRECQPNSRKASLLLEEANLGLAVGLEVETPISS